tara:strand:- start:85 stop:1152 length:1068 start_codon:yes stop_codon:yes gene_type:complete
MKLIANIIHISFFLGSIVTGEIKTKRIKTYSISRNFGTEIRELTQTTFVRYNSKHQIVDSTLYIHNIPLSEKYSYMNFNDRKSLQKLQGVERIMHFKYEYNIEGKLISKFLFGNNNDSLKWREFYKYYSNGNLWKIIRFDPSKVNTENKIDDSLSDPNNMPWGETFTYNDAGTIKEHKEFYAGFIIESTIYDTDTSGSIIIKEENFDPSIMKKTTYSYNDNGLVNEIINSRRGFSIGSEIHTYDKSGRKNKIDYFDLNGNLEKTSTYLYDIHEKRKTKIITDSSKKLIRRIETKNNSNNKKIIQATFDGKSRLIQKKTIGYDINGRLSRIHDYDMLKPGEDGTPILINIITYEYD